VRGILFLLIFSLPFPIYAQSGAFIKPSSPIQPVTKIQPSVKKDRPIQIAFFQLEAQGVEPKTASIVSDMILSEMHKMRNTRVIGSKEIDAMLGYEQKKQLGGCTDTSCMVAIGGALGVDKILLGGVGRIGNSYTLNLRLINIQTAELEKIYNKRMKGGSEEDILDIIPEALAVIFPEPSKTNAPALAIAPPAPVEVVDLQRTPSQVKPPENVSGKVESAGAKRSPTAREVTPFSHAGKFLLGAKFLATIPSFKPAGELFVGFGAGKWVEVGAEGIFSASIGVAPRATFIVYNPDGAVKPYLAARIPYYRSAGENLVGVGAFGGVQWDFYRMLGANLEIGAEYYFLKPWAYKSVVPIIALGLQARF